MDPKVSPKLAQNSYQKLDIFGDDFIAFHVPISRYEITNMSQDCLQKRSKKAGRTKTHVGTQASHRYVFARDLEHQASHESPKMAKEPPKTAIIRLRGAQKQGASFDDILDHECSPT